MCRAAHALFCESERVLEPRHEPWSVAGQHNTEITTCDQTEGRDCVYTSRFVRVIRDSEDQSKQAQDRDNISVNKYMFPSRLGRYPLEAFFSLIF